MKKVFTITACTQQSVTGTTQQIIVHDQVNCHSHLPNSFTESTDHCHGMHKYSDQPVQSNVEVESNAYFQQIF